MHDWLSMMHSGNGVAIVLLLRTISATVQAVATMILFRALYLLHRNGEAPRGFVSIAAFMLFGSATRMSRLLLTWFGLQPPDWLYIATESSCSQVVSSFRSSSQRATFHCLSGTNRTKDGINGYNGRSWRLPLWAAYILSSR